MTEEERITELRDFESLKFFESKDFKIESSSKEPKIISILRLPNGYIVDIEKTGKTLFMPNSIINVETKCF